MIGTIIMMMLFLQFRLSESGYGQWISVRVQNRVPGHTLTVRNGFLKWGKWYGSSKDQTVGAPLGNINYFSEMTINSCGRDSSWTGTEGFFDIYDQNNNYVAQVTWDCPWSSSPNKYSVQKISNRLTISTNTNNLNSGPIGQRIITITNNVFMKGLKNFQEKQSYTKDAYKIIGK